MLCVVIYVFYAVCGQPNVSDLLNYANLTTEDQVVGSFGTAFCKPGYKVRGRSNNETSLVVKCWVDGEWMTLSGCEPMCMFYLRSKNNKTCKIDFFLLP